MRLGGGEYDGKEMGKWEARCLFLGAIEKVAPHVLQDLKELSGDSLEAWAEKYNLTNNWIINTARDTLKMWDDFPELTEGPLEWIYPSSSYWLPIDKKTRRISYNHSGWDPAGETRASFKERTMNNFEKYLEKYMDSLEGLTQEKGYIKSKEKYTAMHFEWLVEYQVNNKSFSSIGHESRKNVEARVKEAAELCGIKLRPRGKPGRPRKQ